MLKLEGSPCRNVMCFVAFTQSLVLACNLSTTSKETEFEYTTGIVLYYPAGGTLLLTSVLTLTIEKRW